MSKVIEIDLHISYESGLRHLPGIQKNINFHHEK